MSAYVQVRCRTIAVAVERRWISNLLMHQLDHILKLPVLVDVFWRVGIDHVAQLADLVAAKGCHFLRRFVLILLHIVRFESFLALLHKHASCWVVEGLQSSAKLARVISRLPLLFYERTFKFA